MNELNRGTDKHPEEFRNYAAEARRSVKQFYALNHARQTLDFVRRKHAEYLPLRHAWMSIWEAMASLDRLVDDSDPDLELPQIDHALQTAEALRAAGEPRWLILTGFLHDLGKVLCAFDEPQWAVVGDTFPVGCAFDASVVYAESFAGNPDYGAPELRTKYGIYEPGCGLDQLLMSWGHDEYLYHVLRSFLPEPALYVIRYHSFYALHREGAYTWFLNERDRSLLPWVKRFNPYDLYSKSAQRPDVGALRPYYEDLVADFLPATLSW